MKLYTRDFGETEVSPEDVIEFVQPVYGFEQLSKYVFLYDQNNSHIVWLQSAEEKDICFILMDPAVVDPSYDPIIPKSTRKLLGEGDCMLWLVTVIAQKLQHSTVNLKSPVIVNPSTRKAVQIILEGDYPIRCPLKSKERED